MGRLIFFLVLVALIGAVGLYGYSFALSADPSPVRQEVTIELD